jgi:hypothetical protein
MHDIDGEGEDYVAWTYPEAVPPATTAQEWTHVGGEAGGDNDNPWVGYDAPRLEGPTKIARRISRDEGREVSSHDLPPHLAQYPYRGAASDTGSDNGSGADIDTESKDNYSQDSRTYLINGG